MSDRKALLLLAAALFLTTSALAAEVNVAGLDFENVKPHFTDSDIRFETSYMNQTLSPTQVFVPDQLHKNVGQKQYQLTTWDGYNDQGDIISEEAILNVGYQFENPSWSETYTWQDSVYPTRAVARLLGNCGGEYYGGCQNSSYPQTYFDAYQQARASIDSENESRVFTFSFNDTGTTSSGKEYSVEWDIDVRSHYEHLIVNYDLIYNESGKPAEVVWESQNVYSGDDPQLIPVSGQINKYDGLNTPSDDYVDRFLMQYDRRYEENPHNVTVVIAHPKDEKLLSVDFGRNTEELNSSHYSEVVDTAQQVNKTATLLNDTTDYSIKAYNTTIEANSTTTLQYKIDSWENETNNLRMWILGSFAGGSGISSDPYEISTCSQFNDMYNHLSSSFELVSDINCSGTTVDGMAYESTTSLVFDGNGHTISNIDVYRYSNGIWGTLEGTVYNLRIRKFSADYIGGRSGSVAAVVKNGGLVENVSVSGSFEVGSSSGTSYGECAKFAGGFVGFMDGDATIRNSYSHVNITLKCENSIGNVAGFAMAKYSTSTLKNTFSTGKVVGERSVKYGFVSSTYEDPTVTNGYWDTVSSGMSTSEYGTGLTTSEMTGSSASSYMNFDFANDWCTRENNYPGLQILGECNSPPVIDSLKNPSDSAKVDSKSPVFSVNVSDPDEDPLTVEYYLNGSVVGEKTGVSSGSTSTFEVSGLDWGTQYNWGVVVSDDSGASVSSSTYSFTTQKQPQITGGEVVVSDGSASLEFGLDPQGESDIAGFHGLSSASMFTNSSLKSSIGFPFQASVNVSDSKGAYSGNKDVDLARTDTGHRQDTDQVSSLSTQYLNQTYTLVNQASDPINYTVGLSIPGTLDSPDQWAGLLSGGSSVTHTVESHGDWIVNETLSTVNRGQNTSKTSSLTSQYVFNRTELTADLKTLDISLSNVDLSSTCSIDTQGNISKMDSLLTKECWNRTFAVDHVKENLSEVRPVNDTIRIGSTIKATRTAQVNNTADLNFQNLSTTTAFNQKACSQENQSVVDLPPQAEKEFAVEYSCSTGTVYDQDTEVLLNTPSSYYDTVKLNFNVKVPSNATEESTLKIKLDKDNAPEWDNRESSSVDINASGSGLNINETQESIYVIVPEDYGNSSLHEGTYNGILKYKYRTSSEGGGTGGSSGGSGPVPPPKPTNNTTVKASFDTQQYYTVDYGGTQVKYLTVYNFDKEPNRVTVATRNSTACRFVEVKSAVNVQEPYRSNVTTLVPSKTQGTYKQSSSILLKARFEIPSKEKLRELGLDGKFTCKFDTEASQGEAGQLAVTVKPVQRFDPIEELKELLPQLPDQLVRSEKVCLSSSLSSAYSYSDSGKCKGQVEQVPVPTKDSAGLLGTALFGFLLVAWTKKRWI